MKIKLIGSYVGAVLCGLVVLLAGLLVILQWGNGADFSLFGKNYDNINTALLMVVCLAFGAMLPWLLKLLLHCVMIIRRQRRQSATISKAVNEAVRSKQE